MLSILILKILLNSIKITKKKKNCIFSNTMSTYEYIFFETYSLYIHWMFLIIFSKNGQIQECKKLDRWPKNNAFYKLFYRVSRSQIWKQIRAHIFAARREHEAALFSRLCEPAACFASELPHLVTVLFSVAETRSWHQDVVITRSVHFSVSPDRRVGPSTAVGRGPCVLQIKLSWKQTGTSQPRPNKLTPPRYRVPRADHGVLFPNSRMLIHFSLLVCWLQRLHAACRRFYLKKREVSRSVVKKVFFCICQSACWIKCCKIILMFYLFHFSSVFLYMTKYKVYAKQIIAFTTN